MNETDATEINEVHTLNLSGKSGITRSSLLSQLNECNQESLRQLCIHSDDCKLLEAELFKDLKLNYLTHLTLESPLMSIPDNIFAELTHLQHLDLSGCHLESVPVNLFRSLTGLLSLNLSGYLLV